MYAPQGYEPLRETHEAAKIGFILTELDLALTFCKIADSADDEGRASRNRAHARKAYDSAIHFLGSATLTESQSRRYQEANGLASLLHVSRGERLWNSRTHAGPRVLPEIFISVATKARESLQAEPHAPSAEVGSCDCRRRDRARQRSDPEKRSGFR